MDLIVGIFGSGSAALRYFEILSKIGVQCVFIREDNEKLVRDNSTYPTVHFKNLKRVNSVIIASSTEKRYSHIRYTLDAGIKHLLIEKPLFTMEKEADLISSLGPNDYILHSGDQYFYDDLLDELSKVPNAKSIKVEFSEYIQNVTKGRKDSYALVPGSGGAKWTFSHSLFVVLLYLYKLDPKSDLESSRVIATTETLKKFQCQISYNGLMVSLNNKFLEFNSPKCFQMVVECFDGSVYVCDFVKRAITCKSKVIFSSNFSRYDLIEKATRNFILQRKNSQFYLSNITSRILGMSEI